MLKTTLPKILYIDENTTNATQVFSHLRRSFQTDLAVTPRIAFRKLAASLPDAVILGGQLTEMSTLSLCRRLHADYPRLSLVCIAAVTTDNALFLHGGADAVINLPLNLATLEAQLTAIIRRNPQHRSEILQCGSLAMDTAKRRVTRNGQTIDLRPKEYLILECLLRRAEQAVSRQTINDHAWGNLADWNIAIDVHISLLRSKIDAPFGSRSIRTVYHIGYMLVSED